MADEYIVRQQDLVENPSARVPICLVLDTSSSMSGAPIRELNEGVQLLASLGLRAGKNADQIALPAAGVLVADARKVLDGQISVEFISAIAQHRHWDRAGVDAVPA